MVHNNSPSHMSNTSLEIPGNTFLHHDLLAGAGAIDMGVNVKGYSAR